MEKLPNNKDSVLNKLKAFICLNIFKVLYIIRLGFEKIYHFCALNSETKSEHDRKIEEASMLLLTTSRAIVKYQLVDSAQKQDPLWGGIVNILTVLTEEADLRSWNMLPATIQFAYLEPLGNDVIINRRGFPEQKIVLRNHSQNVILINNFSGLIFQYQQN